MKARTSITRWTSVLVTIVFCGAAAGGVAVGSERARTKYAWTLDEALGHLALNPRDPYIQYVALQLAHREGKLDQIAERIGQLDRREDWRRGRRDDADLFSTFSGALAVQESLQLDTMRGERPARSPQQRVAVEDLQPPTLKSHPWSEMLAGRDPKVSELSQMVPADQYLVECRTLTKLLELTETADLWGTHLFNQAAQDATTARVGERLKDQLALRTSGLTRPFYDLVVERVAVTGSDLYLREGSDVTLIFQVKQPAVFKTRMDQFLGEAAAVEHAARSEGEFRGVKYVHVTTPDRSVHVFSAYPREDLHVRSNSIVGLTRVLAAIEGKDRDGQPITTLGNTDEFKYIRTLMPAGAEEEDVLIYLSDPFIRNVVGPRLKLTERRRLLAYNHLRMINHAAMMYRTQYGKRAESLAELVEGGCAQDVYGEGTLENPNGGEYSLGPDGLTGQCTVVGSAAAMVPCCEIPLEGVTQEEADAYQSFREQYDQYWRTFFDPIAVRIRMTPAEYRAETIVLPLINNSIYQGLAQTLGGEPQPLDDLPVPKGNIFSIAFNFNKDAFARSLPDVVDELERNATRELGVSPEALPDLKQFAMKGLGTQVGFHIYDAETMFEFNLTGFLGNALGSFSGRNWFGNNEMVWISALITSLNSPVYVSIPVKDAAIVDGFFEKLDPLMAALARRPAQGWWFEVGQDFYELPAALEGSRIRTFSLSFGPLKWRFFWARIGDGLYVATKKFVLDDIAEAHAGREEAKRGGADAKRAAVKAHAMLRVRPQNWNKVLDDFQLGWAENNRRAILNNLGLLTGAARGYLAEHPDAAGNPQEAAKSIVADAADLFGVDFLKLDGAYVLAEDGRTMGHTIYGTQLEPRQPPRLPANSEMSRLLGGFSGVTTELTFLEDGLHAVVRLERKAPQEAASETARESE
ncbi:MAG: hypothetical protein KY476_02360 [Planctomycetes bacterium]|nr:hypothetical protein [Planctomycetota bacterium]